jgi:hypothetical protein
MTHATGGTDDVIYGCASDQALSASQQIRNADNFNVSVSSPSSANDISHHVICIVLHHPGLPEHPVLGRSPKKVL